MEVIPLKEAKYNPHFFQKNVKSEDIEELKSRYPQQDIQEILDRMAEVHAENAMLRAKEKDREDLEARQEEKELIKYLKDFEDIKSMKKEERTLVIPFFFPNKSSKYPYKLIVLNRKKTLFMGPHGPYPYLRGIALEHTDNSDEYGPYIHLILGKETKHDDENIAAIALGYGFQIGSLIQGFDTIVQQAKSTRTIILNLDEDGRHPPLNIQVPKDAPAIREFHDGIKEMLDIDIFKLKQEGKLDETSLTIIQGIYERMNRHIFELTKAKMEQSESAAKRINAEIKSSEAAPLMQAVPAQFDFLKEKNTALVDKLFGFSISQNINEWKRIESETFAKELIGDFKEVVRKYTSGLSQTERERLNEEIDNTHQKAHDKLAEAVNMAKTLMVGNVTPPVEIAQPKSKETPKQEA